MRLMCLNLACIGSLLAFCTAGLREPAAHESQHSLVLRPDGEFDVVPDTKFKHQDTVSALRGRSGEEVQSTIALEISQVGASAAVPSFQSAFRNTEGTMNDVDLPLLVSDLQSTEVLILQVENTSGRSDVSKGLRSRQDAMALIKARETNDLAPRGNVSDENMRLPAPVVIDGCPSFVSILALELRSSSQHNESLPERNKTIYQLSFNRTEYQWRLCALRKITGSCVELVAKSPVASGDLPCWGTASVPDELQGVYDPKILYRVKQVNWLQLGYGASKVAFAISHLAQGDTDQLSGETTKALESVLDERQALAQGSLWFIATHAANLTEQYGRAATFSKLVKQAVDEAVFQMQEGIHGSKWATYAKACVLAAAMALGVVLAIIMRRALHMQVSMHDLGGAPKPLEQQQFSGIDTLRSFVVMACSCCGGIRGSLLNFCGPSPPEGLQARGGHWRWNDWFTVHMDLTTLRVRDPLVTVAVGISALMWANHFQERIKESVTCNASFCPLVMYISFLVFSFVAYIILACLLVGNSIYHHKLWLTLGVGSVILRKVWQAHVMVTEVQTAEKFWVEMLDIIIWFSVCTLVVQTLLESETFFDRVRQSSRMHVKRLLTGTEHGQDEHMDPATLYPAPLIFGLALVVLWLIPLLVHYCVRLHALCDLLETAVDPQEVQSQFVKMDSVQKLHQFIERETDGISLLKMLAQDLLENLFGGATVSEKAVSTMLMVFGSEPLTVSVIPKIFRSLRYILLFAFCLGTGLSLTVVRYAFFRYKRAAREIAIGQLPDADIAGNAFYATFFVPVLFSTSFIVFWIAVVASAGVFFFITLLCVVYGSRVDSGRDVLLGFEPYIAVLIVVWLLNRSLMYLLDSVITEPHQSGKTWSVKYPVLYSVVFPTLMISNFIVGILAFVTRCASVIGLLLGYLVRVDKSVLPTRWRRFDVGYRSFLAVVSLGNRAHNFVYIAALDLMMPTVHDTWTASAEDDENTLDASSEEPKKREAQNRKLRVRNRFWLYVVLTRNPSLAEHRRRGRQVLEQVALKE